MAVIVSFENENNSYAEQVAIFDSSESYNACLEELEKLAEINRFEHVTESCDEDIAILKDLDFVMLKKQKELLKSEFFSDLMNDDKILIQNLIELLTKIQKSAISWGSSSDMVL